MKPVISVENLSKAYRIGLKEEIPDTLTGALTSWLKAPLRNLKRLRRLNTFSQSGEGQGGENRDQRKENGDGAAVATTHQSRIITHQPEDIVWALKDVSFDVNEGEVVGIIGRNGAGKSTLLKILSRITEPTGGRAVIRGRVGSLLEVGTGFHPELTGRENVYMNGTILGMTKREIDRKFDEIVDFSGVEMFLDTPIKRYSSGMQVRLAFAVAAHLDPEILIVDEVLAVGDAEFQKRCLGKMQDVAKDGRTVLFVSHNLAAVQSLCTRALWVRDGSLHMQDTVIAVIEEYVNNVEMKPLAAARQRSRKNKKCWINFVKPVATSFPCGAPLEFVVTVDGVAHTGWLAAVIANDMGTEIVQCDSRLVQLTFHSGELPFTSRLIVRTPWLKPGRYRLDMYAIADGDLDTVEGATYFDVRAPYPYPVNGTTAATKRGVVCGDFTWCRAQNALTSTNSS